MYSSTLYLYEIPVVYILRLWRARSSQALKLTSAPVFLHVPPRGAPKWKSMSTGAQGGGKNAGEAGSILVGPDVFDLAHQGFQAEVIAKWVSERTELHVRPLPLELTLMYCSSFFFFSSSISGLTVAVVNCNGNILVVGLDSYMYSTCKFISTVQVRVFRPPNYVGMLALGVLIALVLALLYVKRSSLDFLYNRTAWALMAIVCRVVY